MWKERQEAICEVIDKVNADIICLQEVRSFIDEKESLNVAQHIAYNTGYPFSYFKEYPDSPDDGLAFLSKIPISEFDAVWNKDTIESNYCAIRMGFKYGNYDYGITNVHLNWRSAEIREDQIKTVNAWISENTKSYEIICGDFNDSPDSIIHKYLRKNNWSDVAILTEEKNNIKAKPTFDFLNNPHLKSNSNLTSQFRYDWILIRKHQSLKLPSKLV